MIKFVTLKKHRRAISLGVVVVAVLALLFTAGWLRDRVLPAATGVFYRHGIAKTYDGVSTAIGDPLGKMGTKNLPPKYSCSTYMIEGIHTEVGCELTGERYAKLSDIGSKAEVLNRVAIIEQKLSAEGFRAGSNSVTLTGLVTGTYDGKDYTADALYQKVIGKYHCVYDTQIAYANPAPPAIHSQLSCTRTINVLGTPTDAIYQSDKGYN